jgi:hypothetical protein
MTEPDRTPHFTKLRPLQARLLKIHQRGPHPETVESTLVDLVESLEKAHFRARFELFIGENFDNNSDIRNLRQVQRELESIGESLEKACAIRNSFYRF